MCDNNDEFFHQQRDAESPLSANTQDSNTSQDYDNNLNIRGEDNSRKLKPSKFSFDTRNIKGSNGSTQLLVGPKITVSEPSHHDWAHMDY